jgi:hapalindole-type alkaloid chlorinase
MADESRPGAAFAIAELGAGDVSGSAHLLADILDGRRLGAVIRGVFPQQAAQALIGRIESGDCPLPRYGSDHYSGYSYGKMLVISPPDLRAYFEEAPALRNLSAAGIDFESRLVELFQSLASGLPVELPKGPGGGPYAPMTIRVLGDGGGIDLHCENETVRFAPMQHLAKILDLTRQVSFYTPLAIPDSGGQLLVYPLRYQDGPGKTIGAMERSGPALSRALAPFEPLAVDPKPGDVLIFDSGRHFHRVTAAKGARLRWTMGGFLARSKNGKAIHYWS